jgi:5-formyltetrahydrofolate cyclo-ligase
MKKLINDFLMIFSKKREKIRKEKNAIRSQIKLSKLRLPEEEKLREATVVFQKIESLNEFKMAQSILLYWSTEDELPTHEIIEKWLTQKFIMLPSIVGDKIILKRFISTDNLVQKSLGIWEPDLTETFTGKIDLAIVPGIAFDMKKNRLGRGKGYYDRFFKKNKTCKFGVGFDFQLANSLPTQRFDMKMDKIITMSNIVE